MLSKDEDLSKYSGKTFFVWEGNYRVMAWKPHIDRLHSNEMEWHYVVNYILLDPTSFVATLLEDMNDVNRCMFYWIGFMLSKFNFNCFYGFYFHLCVL